MRRTLIFIFGLLFVFSPLHAKEFYEKNFDDSVMLEGASSAIHLNGIGFRSKFFIKVYIGALYLKEKASSTETAMNMDGPKRVLMHIVYDEISKEKLVDAWNDGFEDNNSEEELKKLQSRIDKFNNMFDVLKENDVVHMDYVPGKGTTVTISGNQKGVIEGEDFNRALLKIWLGEHPADGDLKDAMLGE